MLLEAACSGKSRAPQAANRNQHACWLRSSGHSDASQLQPIGMVKDHLHRVRCTRANQAERLIDFIEMIPGIAVTKHGTEMSTARTNQRVVGTRRDQESGFSQLQQIVQRVEQIGQRASVAGPGVVQLTIC